MDRNSTFQAFCTPAKNLGEAQGHYKTFSTLSQKIKKATHRISGWLSTSGEFWGLEDGEVGAMPGLQSLITQTETTNLLIIIVRWYGGVHLGSTRFRIINRLANQLIRRQPREVPLPKPKPRPNRPTKAPATQKFKLHPREINPPNPKPKIVTNPKSVNSNPAQEHPPQIPPTPPQNFNQTAPTTQNHPFFPPSNLPIPKINQTQAPTSPKPTPTTNTKPRYRVSPPKSNQPLKNRTPSKTHIFSKPSNLTTPAPKPPPRLTPKFFPTKRKGPKPRHTLTSATSALFCCCMLLTTGISCSFFDMDREVKAQDPGGSPNCPELQNFVFFGFKTWAKPAMIQISLRDSKTSIPNIGEHLALSLIQICLNQEIQSHPQSKLFSFFDLRNFCFEKLIFGKIAKIDILKRKLWVILNVSITLSVNALFLYILIAQIFPVLQLTNSLTQNLDYQKFQPTFLQNETAENSGETSRKIPQNDFPEKFQIIVKNHFENKYQNFAFFACNALYNVLSWFAFYAVTCGTGKTGFQPCNLLADLDGCTRITNGFFLTAFLLLAALGIPLFRKYQCTLFASNEKGGHLLRKGNDNIRQSKTQRKDQTNSAKDLPSSPSISLVENSTAFRGNRTHLFQITKATIQLAIITVLSLSLL